MYTCTLHPHWATWHSLKCFTLIWFSSFCWLCLENPPISFYNFLYLTMSLGTIPFRVSSLITLNQRSFLDPCGAFFSGQPASESVLDCACSFSPLLDHMLPEDRAIFVLLLLITSSTQLLACMKHTVKEREEAQWYDTVEVSWVLELFSHPGCIACNCWPGPCNSISPSCICKMIEPSGLKWVGETV